MKILLSRSPCITLLAFILVSIVSMTIYIQSNGDYSGLLYLTGIENQPDHVTKVLLIAYYRGGSSFLGEIFANNPDAFYVFEPIHALLPWLHQKASQRHLPGQYLTNMGYQLMSNNSLRRDTKAEMKIRLDTLQNTLDCSIANLDKAILDGVMFKNGVHMPKFAKYKECMKYHKHSTLSCARSLSTSCRKFPLVVIKTIRHPLYAVQWMFDRVPDLKVIHYVRDPRAILSSRSKLQTYSKTTSLAQKARTVCIEMQANYLEYVRLKGIYPDHIFLVKYEDLALNPVQTAQQMYAFVGEGDSFPGSVHAWINANTNISSGRHGAYNTYGTRRNSKDSVLKWQGRWSKDEVSIITTECHETLKLLGYSE